MEDRDRALGEERRSCSMCVVSVGIFPRVIPKMLGIVYCLMQSPQRRQNPKRRLFAPVTAGAFFAGSDFSLTEHSVIMFTM